MNQMVYRLHSKSCLVLNQMVYSLQRNCCSVAIRFRSLGSQLDKTVTEVIDERREMPSALQRQVFGESNE